MKIVTADHSHDFPVVGIYRYQRRLNVGNLHQLDVQRLMLFIDTFNQKLGQETGL